MPQLFPEPVLAALRRQPERPAIETGSRVVACGELLDMVRRIAGGMRLAGLGRGVGVAVQFGLTPEAYAAHLAAHALGCRVAPARPAWGAEQLAAALGDVDVVLADDSLDELLGAAPIEVVGQGQPDDIARVVFTSGSTGRPKACGHTYRAMSLAYQRESWPEPLTSLLTHFGRCLVHQPLATPVMFAYFGRCLIAGGRVVLPDGLELAEAIEKLGITATMMHPGRLHEILTSGADLRSLRALMLGGSPASPSLLRTAVARLGPIVWQGYGQAEAGIISMLTPQDIIAGHDSSVGRPVPAAELSFRDGEVCVRSPHMMAGYWNDPEQTQEVLRDGWLYTRDLGHLDDAGYLHLTGRSREVIMVNGEVCYAGAVERVLAGHPEVAQAFAVGVPDPLTGETVHAFIVSAGAEPPGEEVLMSLVRRHLSRNSVPTKVTFISEVPLTEGGKPDKHALSAEPKTD